MLPTYSICSLWMASVMMALLCLNSCKVSYCISARSSKSLGPDNRSPLRPYSPLLSPRSRLLPLLWRCGCFPLLCVCTLFLMPLSEKLPSAAPSDIISSARRRREVQRLFLVCHTRAHVLPAPTLLTETAGPRVFLLHRPSSPWVHLVTHH